jgi:redox-sensitive bicupin YhaK (pirin superfamily)
VLEGELGHRDNLGTGSVIRPGDVQRMSAGTGVTHSEMNASKTQPVHLLQIWIVPDEQGCAPSYEQKAFSDSDRRGTLRLVASPDGRDGSVTIHQDATIAASLLSPGQRVEHTIGKQRFAWVQVARGTIELDGQQMTAGDGASIVGAGTVALAGVDDAELLVFDLP